MLKRATEHSTSSQEAATEFCADALPVSKIKGCTMDTQLPVDVATPSPPNRLRRLRTERMMSKAELARRAGLSALTIDRIERGMACRMDTKRKILEALGLSPHERTQVFPAGAEASLLGGNGVSEGEIA